MKRRCAAGGGLVEEVQMSAPNPQISLSFSRYRSIAPTILNEQVPTERQDLH